MPVVNLSKVMVVDPDYQERPVPRTVNSVDFLCESVRPFYPGQWYLMLFTKVHLRSRGRLLHSEAVYIWPSNIVNAGNQIAAAAERVYQNYMATTRGLKA